MLGNVTPCFAALQQKISNHESLLLGAPHGLYVVELQTFLTLALHATKNILNALWNYKL